MARCRKVPKDILEDLEAARTTHDDERAKMKFGSQKAFFAKIWSRLHDNRPDGAVIKPPARKPNKASNGGLRRLGSRSNSMRSMNASQPSMMRWNGMGMGMGMNGMMVNGLNAGAGTIGGAGGMAPNMLQNPMMAMGGFAADPQIMMQMGGFPPMGGMPSPMGAMGGLPPHMGSAVGRIGANMFGVDGSGRGSDPSPPQLQASNGSTDNDNKRSMDALSRTVDEMNKRRRMS